MVVKRKKKVRKMRGSKTHGYGSKKKHRGAGSRGGRGNAGMKKHKKSYMLKYAPDHFGKKGFKVPIDAKKQVKAITLRDIDIYAKRKKINEINLNLLGYQKVLSTGKITQSLTIIANKIVPKAKEKIKKAGGKAIESE